jgi:hypothetical protein
MLVAQTLQAHMGMLAIGGWTGAEQDAAGS